MEQTKRNTFPRPFLALALAVASLAFQPSLAADNDFEREQLAVLARQLDLIDRLAQHAAKSAPQTRADLTPSRYHFDYDRLGADLKRVRAGVQDYLSPQRAQPRDPVPLQADYTRAASEREASTP